MASDADIPFWRRRIVWLAAALVAVLTVVTVRNCRDVTGETFLRKRAEAFLTAGDREDFEACRKAGTLEEKQLRIYRLNRQSLGKLVSRSAARATPLKFGAKEGYLFTFVSRFAEADGIEERVAVLVEPESRKVEIFSVNYHYRRMPRPELKDSYPGTIPADVRAKTLRTGQAFDHGEWKYFEALGRREIGYWTGELLGADDVGAFPAVAARLRASLAHAGDEPHRLPGEKHLLRLRGDGVFHAGHDRTASGMAGVRVFAGTAETHHAAAEEETRGETGRETGGSQARRAGEKTVDLTGRSGSAPCPAVRGNTPP